MAWLAFAVGVALTVAVATSVIGTLVVPRRVTGHIAKAVFLTVAALFRGVARWSHRFETRDRILALVGPVGLMALLAVWVALFLLAYALMFMPFVGGDFAQALIASGSSLFTLGFAGSAAGAPLLAFLAAATGLVVVALLIAYLPVLYGSFNRRETLVTMLDSRAGSPAWGPEVLARAELVDNVENLGALYAQWEQWAADLAESHVSYPALIFFRSPQTSRSWVIALLAVLDAASLHLATRPLTAPASARVCIRMGYVALREIAKTLGFAVNEDPKPDDPLELTRSDFDDAIHHLAHVHWPMERDTDEAWVHFRGWRVNYESLAYAIADAIDAPPALWSGKRSRLPQALQPPARPPHRAPSSEQGQIQDETRKRRRARGASQSAPSIPAEHFHNHDAASRGEG